MRTGEGSPATAGATAGAPGPGARARGHALADLEVVPGAAPAERDLPTLSVIVLNHNGRHHLQGCFDSLAASDYPRERLEALLVDNGSTDGSLEEMGARHAWVRVIANPTNRGFSGGCNQGAESSRADVLVFLNNDMRVEPSFLRELVAPIVRGECQATTARMLSWDGKKINSAGGGMNFHGIGIQQGMMEDPGPQHERPRRSLFACGGAMAIGARVFREVGGFDPEFFAYYEDVDLGWRMWVLGHEVHYAPRAVCYHHHSSTSRTFPPETLRLLQVRDPLLACFKNYDAPNLQRVLPAALALAVRRMQIASGLDERAFRIELVEGRRRSGWLARLAARSPFARPKALEDPARVRRVAAADLVALGDLLGRWEHWTERRREVQSRRVRPDEEIFRLFLKPLWCVEDDPAYRELQDGVAALFGIDRLFEGLTVPGPDPHR